MNKFDLWSGVMTTPAELAKVFTWRFRRDVLGIRPVDSNSFDVCVEQINGQLISIRADQKIKYIGAGKWLVVIESSKL